MGVSFVSVPTRGARFHYRITSVPVIFTLPAVICGKETSLAGKSPVTVNILYSETSFISAGNLLVMIRSQPVIAGNYSRSGGAVRYR